MSGGFVLLPSLFQSVAISHQCNHSLFISFLWQCFQDVLSSSLLSGSIYSRQKAHQSKVSFFVFRSSQSHCSSVCFLFFFDRFWITNTIGDFIKVRKQGFLSRLALRFPGTHVMYAEVLLLLFLPFFLLFLFSIFACSSLVLSFLLFSRLGKARCKFWIFSLSLQHLFALLIIPYCH